MRLSLRTWLLVAGLSCVGLALAVLTQFVYPASGHLYGATFSPAYARFLGLDSAEVFIAMLDELQPSQVRIPVHWDEVQSEFGQNDFAELDWLMQEAANRRVGVILAIGNKVPRWPECYTPGWASKLSAVDYEQALLDYVELVVTRYRDHSALKRWQVENEVLFPFGKCPQTNYQLVEREIARVRLLDPQHPIQLTVSGEQQLWIGQAADADIIGTSLYRRVALPNGFRFTFPIPPQMYALQALSLAWLVDEVVISELQAEPWLIQDYRQYSAAEAAQLFTPQQLLSYVRYAHNTSLKEISFWGVEWWYYLKQHGYPELWETGRSILTQ